MASTTQTAVPAKPPAPDPCAPCPSWWAAAARDACERGRAAKGCDGNPKPSQPPQTPAASGGGGGGGQPDSGGMSGGGGGGESGGTPMVTPISTMPPISTSGSGTNVSQLQSLLTNGNSVPVQSGGYAAAAPNFGAGAFQERSNQLRAQGQAAGDQAGKALTNKFAGRGFSTASNALGQQKMLAGLMGQAQGVGAANKEMITMGGEDQAFAAIKRQMEQDRIRNAQLMSQAGTQAQLQLLGGLAGALR